MWYILHPGTFYEGIIMSNIILLHKPDLPYHSISHEKTVLQEWINLVKVGEDRASIPLGEELESFLVFTLMRFVNKTNIFTINFSVEYLEASISSAGKARETHLSDIADICLVHAGLFPERYKKIGISSTYFRNIGCAALDDLATLSAKQKRKGSETLYKRARDAFPFLTEVLLATREDTDYLSKYSLLKI